MKPNYYLRSFLLLIGLTTLLYVSMAQERILISGTIADEETKETLIGASVLIKNTISGTVTDMDGKFKLQVPGGEAKTVLQISYVGFETQEVEVSATNPVVSVSLKVRKMLAKEVVVSASRISERILESPVSIEKSGCTGHYGKHLL